MSSSIHFSNQSENVFHTCTITKKSQRFEVCNACIFESGDVLIVAKGTSEVFRPFLTYLPTYHVRRFFHYNIRYLGAFLDPPSYPKIGRHLWTFPNAKSLTNKLQQKVAIKCWLKKVVVHTCSFCILTHGKITIFAMAGE